MRRCSDSTILPDDLRGLGYHVQENVGTERILPAAVVERFARGSSGELEPITAESTRPIAETRTHAGIVAVNRHAFEMP